MRAKRHAVQSTVKSFNQALPWSAKVDGMKNGNAGSDGIQPGLDHRITYRFSKIAARHARAFSTVYGRKFKLTVNTWMILGVIGRFAPMSANTAGTHSSLESGQSHACRRCARKPGLRRSAAGPGRTAARLSFPFQPKSKRVHDELNQLRDAIEHEFLRVLTSAEVATLYQIVDKLDAQAIRLFNDKRDGLATGPRRPDGQG